MPDNFKCVKCKKKTINSSGIAQRDFTVHISKMLNYEYSTICDVCLSTSLKTGAKYITLQSIKIGRNMNGEMLYDNMRLHRLDWQNRGIK